MKEIDKTQQVTQFELFHLSGKRKGTASALPVHKRKILIGRDESIDIPFYNESINSIHAVIEQSPQGHLKIYDLNSSNGTYVNGEKIIVSDLKAGDHLKLGDVELELRKLHKKDLVSAPLESFSSVPLTKDLPESAPDIPYISYPLAKDTSAEFSDYIFEDTESIYPIFSYQVEKAALEIIVVYKDIVQSVDYLPKKNGTFYLKGASAGKSDILLPYLSKKEKIPFIQIKEDRVELLPIEGHSLILLGEEQEHKVTKSISIDNDQIIRLKRGNIDIFVRRTEAPPVVESAPVQTDPLLTRYLLICCLLAILFLLTTLLVEVTNEDIKEKAPERIAKIYERKFKSEKPKPKKEIRQVSKRFDPNPNVDLKNPKDEVFNEQKSESKNKVPSGVKEAQKTGKVKKVEANRGRKNKKVFAGPTNSKKTKNVRRSKSNRRKSPRRNESKGAVDTYQSSDFKGQLSSLLSKGGGAKEVKIKDVGSTFGDAGKISESSGATSPELKSSTNIGSLSGSIKGKLDVSKGGEGIVNKESIFTAGLPYKTVILGSMDPSVIRKIFEQHMPQFKYCHRRSLESSRSKFDGILKFNFIIGASGHITKAGILNSKDVPVNLRSCTINVLRGMRFPAPKGGGIVEATQPINLKVE